MTKKQAKNLSERLTEKKTGAGKKAPAKEKSNKTTKKPVSQLTEKKKSAEKEFKPSKHTTDKVGDILVNQAGVKYKITDERLAPITGYNPGGKIKTRVLEITPLDKRVNGGKPFEMNEASIKYSRDRKILKREKEEKK